MKKKLLFVINTMGGAGAERVLLTVLRAIDPEKYDVSLFVLMGQGELIAEVPDYVHKLNKSYEAVSVLADEGKRAMKNTVIRSALHGLTGFKLLPYMLKNYFAMLRGKKVRIDKLLWRVLSDGAEEMNDEYDLAVAFLEGGSTYFVSDHIRAKKKSAFVHVDYGMAGYTRELDLDAYERFDKIYAISGEVRESFLAVHPECGDRTDIFENIIDVERIKRMSDEAGGFTDDFDGVRVLTVGRLNQQKAYEIAIDAMRIIKDRGCNIRWYVLGEGELHGELSEKIRSMGLMDSFFLYGASDNPYPYFRECDIYVHATRYEGKSIAVREAQVLSKPIIVSDVPGNREQIRDGIDGRIVALDAEAIADMVIELAGDEAQCKRLAAAAGKAAFSGNEELSKLLSMAD